MQRTIHVHRRCVVCRMLFCVPFYVKLLPKLLASFSNFSWTILYSCILYSAVRNQYNSAEYIVQTMT